LSPRAGGACRARPSGLRGAAEIIEERAPDDEPPGGNRHARFALRLGVTTPAA
jgi:hypothetical protein